MAQKDYKKLVEAKSKQGGNQFCVDCNAKNPKWGSLMYGTFFCLECAATHRSLGVYLDFVKNVTLDDWDEEAYLPMEYGGNEKFLKYIAECNIDTSNTHAKYENSKTIAYSQDLMNQIKKETGKTLRAAEKKPKAVNRGNTQYIRQPAAESENKPSIYNSSNLTSSLTNLTSAFTSKVKSFTEQTVKYGAKIGTTVKTQAKSLMDKGTESYNNFGQEKIKTSDLKPNAEKPRKTKDWS